MYPNLYYAFKDLFGVEWTGLRFVNSFGFFVALAFVGAAMVLTHELKRKSRLGYLHYQEAKITVGEPASPGELIMNFIIGFLLGYKIIGAFVSNSPLAENPQEYIFSLEGNWPIGIILGLVFAGMKWYEKNKQRLPKTEQRTIRIWPEDRVGDLVIYAAIFGFLGAKIFHNLENWNELVADPVGSLLSFSGLTFYGGLICAAVAISLYARKHGIAFWHLADSVAPALMLAYAIGRIGCQVSGDGDWGILNSAYITSPDGKTLPSSDAQFNAAVSSNAAYYTQEFGSVTQVPHVAFKGPSFLPDWMVAYSYPNNVINAGTHIPDCQGQYCSLLPVPVFPTPFYEIVTCLVLFFILWALRKRLRVPGQLFAIYLILNGLERFLVEKIRVNTKYDFFGFHPTQAEIISFLLVLSGVIMLVFLKKKNPSGTVQATA
jgi:prolipoprotein diacylglyceryltransferase